MLIKKKKKCRTVTTMAVFFHNKIDDHDFQANQMRMFTNKSLQKHYDLRFYYIIVLQWLFQKMDNLKLTRTAERGLYLIYYSIASL